MAVVSPRRPPIQQLAGRLAGQLVRRLMQRLALAWLRHQLDRRVAAELRADERRRRLARPPAAGQVFHAVIQINLAPRSH